MICAAMLRPPTTATEASALLAALLERRFDGALPALSPAVDFLARRLHLKRLPLAETLPLHGRALFAAASLEPTAREHAAWGREDFFGELGAALGVSARVLLAAVRAQKFPLVPPRPLAGYEYLGSFRSGGQLDIADPCHLRKTSRMPAAIFSLSCPVEVEPRRPARRYAVSATFEVGDTIEHPKFGSGSVLRVIDGKIEVEFADDFRTLVHGKQ